jgi:predicted dehydrogenase
LFVVTTNGPSHHALAIAAMQRGVKRVLVSKPLACTLSDAEEMVRMADENQVRLAVDHGLRHDSTYKWINEKIQSGEWGALRSVYVMRNGIGLGCLGVHSFDLVNSLVKSHPMEVTGWIDEPVWENPRGSEFTDPGGLVVMRYQNGVKGIVSQLEDGAGPMSVEINLTGARIQVCEKFGKLELATKDPSWVAKSGKSAPLVRTENPAGAVSHDVFDLMKKVLLDLASDQPLQSHAGFGKQSFEILLAAYLSHEAGNIPVALPIDEEKARQKFLPIT